MADLKISAAADAGTLVGTDKVPLARSASTTAYAATMAEISSWANTQLPVASTTVPGVVKVDGTTITIAGGTISGTAAPLASSSLPFMDGTAAPGTATAWSRGDHVHPSDTAKAPLASPPFTGTPTAPTPTTGDNSTKIATTAFVQAQMVASGAGVSTWNTRAGAVVLQQSDITAVGALNDTGRNLIHNGRFEVAQRGAGPFTTAATNTLDRWVMVFTLDTFSVTSTSLSDADRTAIGDEAARVALGNTVTGNAGATALSLVSQRIEDVRRLAGKTVTLSFWARGSAAGLKLGACIEQAFGAGGSPSAYVTGVGQSVTLSTSWARYSLTFAVPTIVGKTLGTDGSDYTALMLWFSCGTTNATRAGSIGVQSGTFFLWGIQLEIGSVATPLAKREYADELALCQRFYFTDHVRSYGAGVNGATLAVPITLPVSMRAAPTCVANWQANPGVTSPNIAVISASSILLGGTENSTSYGLDVIYTASADL